MLQLRFKNMEKGPVWLVEPLYSLGADENCKITIKNKSVSAEHAMLSQLNDQASIEPVNNSAVWVNGEVITEKTALNSGDLIKLGHVELEIADPKEAISAPTQIKTAAMIIGDWKLKALNTALANRDFDINNETTIGRSVECDISLSLVHLSRKHAKFIKTDRGFAIQDLNSSNGTYVNDEKIDYRVLRSGDEISFDTLRFRVIGPGESPESDNDDIDKTTMRPAINVQRENAFKPDNPSPIQRPNRPRPNVNAEVPQAPTAEDPGSSNMIIWIVIFIVIIVVGVVAFGLSQ